VPRTPDRRGGAPLREEEGAYFDEQAAPASVEGQYVYYAGRWSFFDSTGEFDPRSGGGISEAQHKTLRHLIHFIKDGPAGGFASGAYKETTYTGIKATSEIWYVDATKAKKIVELTTTWTGIKITAEEWKVYDTDGTTVLATVTDAITYTGLKETSRTRTIA
jgi:hypothetical protein